MKIIEHIFREYDIRGYVGSELTPEFAYALGRGYGTLVRERGLATIAVGWDCRHSSPLYANELARGITDEGVDVVMTGMGPTPQLYFAVHQRNYGGGIQVTGSHNPSDMNGFKLLLGKETLSGAQIQELKHAVIRALAAPSAPLKGKLHEDAVQADYIMTLTELSRAHLGKRKLKIVADAGNGVGGMVGVPVLRALGHQVIELYCEPDGNFPNHHPDPTVIENIAELRKRVVAEKADCGIGWDGDADRIGVVDEKGQVLFGDMLLAIYSRQLLKEAPGATVIGDVKCSTLLFDDIRKHGGHAIMWKTGHSLIKAKLKETHAALAGEMSGHIFFKHRFFGFDDGIHASCRLLEILSNTSAALSSLLSDLPRMVSTPEIRLDCPEELKFKVAQEAVKAFSAYKVDTTDGVRITFEHGWGLVRASNTQPVLVMRFEATTQALLAQYQELVTTTIERLQHA